MSELNGIAPILLTLSNSFNNLIFTGAVLSDLFEGMLYLYVNYLNFNEHA